MIINYSFILTQPSLGEEEINHKAETILKEFQDFFKTDDGVIKYATSITKTLPSSLENSIFKIEEASYLTNIGYSYTNVINFLVCIGIEVPFKFKTNNGYDYDENGIVNLGKWIANQRRNTSPESERGQLLSQIGMRFENKISTLSWQEMYSYAKLYYDDDNPAISDFEYDMLMNELKNLEREFPELITSDSLTQKVGGHVKEGFEKVQHEVPLQSLQDIFSFEELEDFKTRVEKVAKELII